jgi:hypothetical protein
VPLVLVPEGGDPLVEVDAPRLARLLEHVLDAWHHSLEATEVNVRAIVERLEDLSRRFLRGLGFSSGFRIVRCQGRRF